MRGALVFAVLAVLAAAAPATAAAAPTEPWDGKNPFDCVNQNVGFGTAFPDPGADPFCVEFDKRSQNITELGVVDFLSQEPARVAAAGDKCFYFQRDHWRGSVVQGDKATQTYNWDGSYFFDKLHGTGGAFVENFTINGQTGDPRLIPGFPEEYKPFFGPGKGGVKADDTVKADPRCAAPRPKEDKSRPAGSACNDLRGAVGRGVGPLTLGITRDEVTRRIGAPVRQRSGVARFCLLDGNKLAVAYRRGKVVFAYTTSPNFEAARGVHPGIRAEAARRALRHERTLQRRGSTKVLALRGRARTLLVGLRDAHVSFLAVAARSVKPGSISTLIGRTR